MSSIPLEKFVWDASALVELVNSKDPRHWSCYGFMKDHEQATHIFPAIAWMEFQAVQSRKVREGAKCCRDLYLLDHKNIVYDVTHDLVKKIAAHDLHTKFHRLRGMDLIYASIAFLEGASLVTLDEDFSHIQEIPIIYPHKL